MGAIGSKDTRSISFTNTFAVSPGLAGSKSIDDDNVLDINAIAAVADKNNELMFPENNNDVLSLPVENEDSEINYWANRIEYLKKEHLLINEIIEKEYESTLKNTAKLLDNQEACPEKYKKIKPCFEWRTKIMRCYEDNPHQPLVCSPIVQAFSECVTSYHIED